MILHSLQCRQTSHYRRQPQERNANKMKPIHAPIYEALLKHASGKPASFHVPGHQNGQVWEMIGSMSWDQSVNDMIQTFSKVMAIDVTELSSTDDLHHPEASIQEAQQLAALTYHADDTYFLIGGSTSGNLAMLLAVCDPGDTVIVQRNVHKSVINGLRLAGATAVFVSPRLDIRSGLAVTPSAAQIEEALTIYPTAKAVFLSNPNYYGIGAELERYAEVVHRYGVPLLVDEAHGAHYGHHPELPRSAMQSGADAAVQSTHKTLPALTMGAMLHVQGDRVDRDRLQQALALVQSSSPSFPIMASLDISRAMIASFGEHLFQSAIRNARDLVSWLNENELLIQEVASDQNRRLEGHESEQIAEFDKNASWQRDPLRIVIRDATGQLSGHQLKKQLEERGCWAEMSDSEYVVLLIGIGTGPQQIKLLKEALQAIHHKLRHAARSNGEQNHLQQTDQPLVERSRSGRDTSSSHSHGAETMLYRDSEGIGEPVRFGGGWYHEGKSIRLPIGEAVGRRSAEMVVPYPPGIPILYAGERITESNIAQLVKLASKGANFQGARDPRMDTIAVYMDEN